MHKAQNLLEQLLFGLEAFLSKSIDELKKIVEEKYEKTIELNDKKIHLRCSEVQRMIEVFCNGSSVHTIIPRLSPESLRVSML